MKSFESGENLSFLAGETLSADELAWDHAMDVSGSVYARMKELRMSNKELAELLGVTSGRVSQILKGYTGMSLKVLAKLETVLGFRLDGGFSYTPSRKGVSATAEVPLPNSTGATWGDRSRKNEKEEAPLPFRAVKGGLFAA